MTNQSDGNFAERLIIGGMSLFFMLAGWYILLNDGVSLKGKSGAVSFAGGSAGLAIAGFVFL